MAYHYIKPKEYFGTVQFRYWVFPLVIAQLVERRTVNPQVKGSNPFHEIKLYFKNKRNCMDSATMTYLVNSRKFVEKPKNDYDPKYKKRILELTEKLFEDNINNDIYSSFESYISDCVGYLKKMDQDEVTTKNQEEKYVVPQHVDELIFAPKKISVLVKPKQKNIFLIHDKNRA